MSPAELVSKQEEPNEMGGYFICNGLEKIIRLLIVPRANNVSIFFSFYFICFLFF